MPYFNSDEERDRYEDMDPEYTCDEKNRVCKWAGRRRADPSLFEYGKWVTECCHPTEECPYNKPEEEDEDG